MDKIDGAELISVFSEILANDPKKDHESDDCEFCQLTNELFTKRADGLKPFEEEVLAPLVHICIPLPAIMAWSISDSAGFNKFVVVLLLLGLKVGRRQVFAEMCEKGFSANA